MAGGVGPRLTASSRNSKTLRVPYWDCVGKTWRYRELRTYEIHA